MPPVAEVGQWLGSHGPGPTETCEWVRVGFTAAQW